MQRQSPQLASPFLAAEFVIAVGRVRPGARVAVISEQDRPVAFFPFERSRSGLGTPVAAGLTDAQGVVHQPGAEWDPARLLRACRLSAWRFDHLVSDQRPLERFQTALAPSPVLDLSEGYGPYYEKLKVSSRSFVKTLAYKSRKLGRDHGEPSFVLNSTDTGLLRRVMRWKSEQYRSTGRLDRFSQRWIIELTDSLLAERDGAFTGVLSVLYAGDRPIAGHFGLRFDRILAGWFPSYDQAYHRYSPGLLHHLRLAEAAASDGVRRIDMGKGVKGYKESLKSWDLYVAEGAVTLSSPLGRAHGLASKAGHWAVREIRDRPRLFDAADRVLRGYGRMRCSLAAARPSALLSREQPEPPGLAGPSGPPGARGR